VELYDIYNNEIEDKINPLKASYFHNRSITSGKQVYHCTKLDGNLKMLLWSCHHPSDSTVNTIHRSVIPLATFYIYLSSVQLSPVIK